MKALRAAKRAKPAPRNRPGRPGYTPAEDKKLRKLYATATIKELLAALPGHEWSHIKKAAARRGLKRPQRAHNYKWDGHPTTVLQALYPSQGALAVAAALGPEFTLSSIRIAAARLGLCYLGPRLPPPQVRSRLYSEVEKEAIRQLWPTALPQQVLDALPGREWEEICGWARRAKLKRTGPRINAAALKPPKGKKEKPAKAAKPPKQKAVRPVVAKVKPVKAVVVKPPKPPKPLIETPQAKPLPLPGVPDNSRTPLLNALKATRQREAAKLEKSADWLNDMKKLPGAHPARLAFAIASRDGGLAAGKAAYFNALKQAAKPCILSSTLPARRSAGC